MCFWMRGTWASWFKAWFWFKAGWAQRVFNKKHDNQATCDQFDFEGPNVETEKLSWRQHHLFLSDVAQKQLVVFGEHDRRLPSPSRTWCQPGQSQPEKRSLLTGRSGFRASWKQNAPTSISQYHRKSYSFDWKHAKNHKRPLEKLLNDSGRACALTLINFMFAVSIWHRHKNRAEECLLLCRCLVTVGETMIVAVQLSSLCVFPSHEQRKRKNITYSWIVHSNLFFLILTLDLTDGWGDGQLEGF